VQAWLEHLLSGVRGIVVPLRLTDQISISVHSGSWYAQRTCGQTCTLLRSDPFGREQRTIEAVLIPYGLPHVHFSLILAHELGHVWLFALHPLEREKQVEEGFCQLLSFLWLEHLQSRDASYWKEAMLNSDDAVYGDGLRAALTAIGGAGLERIVESVAAFGEFSR